jgi:hypothetical protein
VLTGEDLHEYEEHTLREALTEVNVFARVRPEQKLLLVESLQKHGQIVAMTGDGVNDAPALKRSDVGVAMGQRGSDVSREVADLVLLDDNFATIVRAVEQGRGIYENIQKFLRFLFSTNLSEVLLVSIGAVVAFAIDLRDVGGSLMLPLTAAHILWINLLTYPSRHTWMRPLSNRYLHLAVVGGIGIQLAAASAPFVSDLLGSAALPLELWAVVFAAALGSWGLAEFISRVVWRQAVPTAPE